MEAKELRIGNWINDVGSQQYQVSGSDINELEISNGRGKIHLNFNPISITEEWLVKFGFEKDLDDNFELNDVMIQSWTFCSEFHYVNNHGCSNTNIIYVHQLQNLYFALTGEELTIKN